MVDGAVFPNPAEVLRFRESYENAAIFPLRSVKRLRFSTASY
jgi:hypothetical protein